MPAPTASTISAAASERRWDFFSPPTPTVRSVLYAPHSVRRRLGTRRQRAPPTRSSTIPSPAPLVPSVRWPRNRSIPPRNNDMTPTPTTNGAMVLEGFHFNGTQSYLLLLIEFSVAVAAQRNKVCSRIENLLHQGPGCNTGE